MNKLAIAATAASFFLVSDLVINGQAVAQLPPLPPPPPGLPPFLGPPPGPPPPGMRPPAMPKGGPKGAAPAFAQSKNAQRSSNGLEVRTRMMQECMAMNKKSNTDPFGSAGGVEHMYQACMANKGQMP